MANEKVKLPNEVAEAIMIAREEGYTNYAILRQAGGALWDQKFTTINRWAFIPDGDGDPNMLMSALVNGYETEETPEGKLRDHYKSTLADYEVNRRLGYPFGTGRGKGELKGIETTLNILGITVEGINDKKEDE